MPTVQQADPSARRKAIWMVCISTILGLSAILAFEYFRDDFHAWFARNIGFLLENTIVVFVVSLVLVSPILAAEIYLLLLGNRTVRTQRFPPRAYAVTRDTWVLEGRQAIRRGRLIQILSLFLLFTTGAIPVVMWYVFWSLGYAP